MNHYPFHIGDFNTATRHLSRLERAIYRDALDMYYDSEAPLDGSDFEKLARRLLCRDAEEIAALQFVLEEFFEQHDGGMWAHHRCDREIAKFKAAQADAGVVKSNEKQRQARSRAERSAMFSALKAAGVAVKWNSRMGTLRDLCAQHGIALPGAASDTRSDTAPTVTGGVTSAQCHGSGTATQNQNQNQSIKETSSPKDGDGDGAAVVCVAADTVPKSPGDWSMLFDQEFGVQVDPTDVRDRKKFWPMATAWTAAGVTVGQMRAAVQRARNEATEGIAYLPAYVDRVLASMCAPPAESRAEAAARHRMADAAPLAAARAPSNAPPAAMADGYQFFKDQAEGARALQPVGDVVEVAHA